jgi:thiamine-phosphate pyrophosphorylase
MRGSRGLYLITPAPVTARELAICADVLPLGVAALQLRGKGMARPALLEAGRELRALCRRHDVRFIVNDDLALALELDADGVHLGQRDGSLAAARAALGDKILGVTCHASLELARAAVAQGADYLAFGRCFASRTKPEAPPCPLSLLGEARTAFSLPVVAIGGLCPDNGAQAVQAGADLLAVIDGVFGQRDPRAAVRAFAACF